MILKPNAMDTESGYIFELQAEMLGVLSNPKRLMILKMLGKEEKSVGEIASGIGIEMPNVSQHLRIMKTHGIVTCRREGQTVHYKLATPVFAECCELVRQAIEEDLKKKNRIIRNSK